MDVKRLSIMFVMLGLLPLAAGPASGEHHEAVAASKEAWARHVRHLPLPKARVTWRVPLPMIRLPEPSVEPTSEVGPDLATAPFVSLPPKGGVELASE